MSMSQYFAFEYRGLLDVGAGSISQIGVRFENMGARRIGIITDRGLVDAGVVDMVKDVLDAQRFPVVAGVYDKIEVDAKSSIINDCIRWCGEMGVEGLLAVGGGSVMDSVKAVKTMMAYGVRDVTEIMRGTAGSHIGLKVRPITFPHIAVPTTAGTGAESSPVAVVLIEESDLKGSIMHPDLPANVAVLDPTVTYSLPPRLTAETGCDALSHCMEAYFCMNANSISDALALHAVRLIKKYLPIAIENGRNVEARTQMLIASNMAMQAYSMAATSAPIHNCSHAIGAKLHISHGLANGVLMSTVMKVLAPFYAMRITDFAQAFGVKTEGRTPDEITHATVEALEAFKKECGIPACFAQSLCTEDKEDLRIRIKADIAGFTFPLPMEAIDAIMALSFTQ